MHQLIVPFSTQTPPYLIMNEYNFRLSELNLKRPPVNPNNENGSPSHQAITYNRNKKKDCTANIVILHRSQFGFSFCFKNKYNGGNNLKHSLHIQVLCDPLDRPLSRWKPPRWCVLPSAGQKYFYELTAVGWDENYTDRFSNTGLTKRELLEKLRTIKLDHRQTSMPLT